MKPYFTKFFISRQIQVTDLANPTKKKFQALFLKIGEYLLLTFVVKVDCAHSQFGLFRDLVGWADQVCIADDPAAYALLAQIVRERRVSPARGFAQALVVRPFGCGVGACAGCAVRTDRGFRLACTHGPVFDLLELRQG